jgi:hypothetical protein
MALPHFGSSQPGDTYYLTPLSLYVFDVAMCHTLEGKVKKKINSMINL